MSWLRWRHGNAASWNAARFATGVAGHVSRWAAPTLLIVGGHDDVVLGLNRQAQAGLRCENDLAVVPGATHLFEEPGTLTAAAELARDWFARHLVPSPHSVTGHGAPERTG